MGALHQMGHDSENLLFAPGLELFCGAILSPVNYAQQKVESQISKLNRSGRNLETIFDPQLYVPNSDRGKLRQWSYYPSDVDTADLSSSAWWSALCERIAETVVGLGPSAACSPAIVPRVYSTDHFGSLVEVGECFARSLSGTSIRPVQSAVVGLAEMADRRRVLATASVLSTSQIDVIYLIFVAPVDPRRELHDAEELKGAMRLISLLRQAGYRVLVGFCSSDMLLWKAAGANDCATGKFFNLRRFTRARFEEPSGGMGQLPYWFEESLVAFLREADFLRIVQRDLLSQSSRDNPFLTPIGEAVRDGKPWVKHGWRQFMHWFADAEARMTNGSLDLAGLLSGAEQCWEELESANVLMEERRNSGQWLRAWRRALAEFEH